MSIRLHRNWILLSVALLAGSAAALFAMRYLDGRVADIERRAERATARAVVAKENLAAGERLDHERVAVREVPADWLHSGAITPEQFERAAGSTLAFPAQRGEPLMWSQLDGKRAATFSARLAPGRRALTLAVDEISSIAGMLEPGDTVDLLLTLRRNDGNVIAPLLQGLVVLATGARTAPADGVEQARRDYTTITLDTSVDEAGRIIAARTVGSITALLRAPGDRARAPGRADEALAMLGLRERNVAIDHNVPVIYGGSGNPLRDGARLSARPLAHGAGATQPAAVVGGSQ